MFDTTLPIEDLSATHALHAALLASAPETAETLMLCAGAIAGHAAIASLWEATIRQGATLEAAGLHEIRTLNQNFFYFGAPLDRWLLPDTPGTLWWSLTQAAGLPPSDRPDTSEIVRYVTSTISHPEFGAVRGPASHPALPGTRDILRQIWPLARQALAEQQAETWPLIANLVAGRLLTQISGRLDPIPAVRIAMEAALAGSRIDPRAIRQTLPQR